MYKVKSREDNQIYAVKIAKEMYKGQMMKISIVTSTVAASFELFVRKHPKLFVSPNAKLQISWILQSSSSKGLSRNKSRNK